MARRDEEVKFSRDAIKIDPAEETERLTTGIRVGIARKLHKRGAVVGVSGGVDSSVVLALCVRALGASRVLAVLLPEKESSEENEPLVRNLVKKLGVELVIEDLTSALTGLGCYQRRDQAIRRVFPEYKEGDRAKIGLSSDPLKGEGMNVFSLTIVSPENEVKHRRLWLREYLEVVASSNFKQRARMSMLYYHAERRNYAVVGTSNKNEYELGFFVKYGDGAADLKPILHLFKSQVYQLAEYLNIPEDIRARTPTTDTYSAEQTQEEFFFKVPFAILDRIWYGWEQGIPGAIIARTLGLTDLQVENVIQDIQRKKMATEYLRSGAIPIKDLSQNAR